MSRALRHDRSANLLRRAGPTILGEPAKGDGEVSPAAMRPPARVERFGPGESIARPKPGDFILVRGHGLISPLIHWVQRLRFSRHEDRKFLHWTHVALVTSTHGRIVEVVPRGVVAQQIEKYRRAEYHYVHLDVPDSDRWAGVLFAELCVGQPYGRLSFLALGLAALTRRQLQIQDPRRQHCVSLVIRALERMRGEFGREALDMMPADLAKHYNITPRSEPDPTWHR